MRICGGIAQLFRHAPDIFLAEQVLHFFRIFMHMIRRKSRPLGEVEFPEAVIADHAAGFRPSGIGKGKIPRCSSGKPAGLLERFQRTGTPPHGASLASGKFIGGEMPAGDFC